MADISSEVLATPFHRGELAIQEKLGVKERVHGYAPRFIRSYLPDEHRQFYAQLQQLIVGSVDSSGRPWASMVTGRPGFAASPDPGSLQIRSQPLFGDPLSENLQKRAQLGFLGIEFHTRRRNRVNGKVVNLDAKSFEIAVDQAFGNCPQYIQAREFELTDDIDNPAANRPLHRAASMSEDVILQIISADTLFIASMFSEDVSDRRHGVDVSHRGGRPGFVKVVDAHNLVFPDFAGNFHFNTLGNIALNPKVGLLFPNFENGDIIYITGTAGIIWTGEQLDAFEGAERLVSVHVDEVIHVEKSLPLRAKFQSYAPDLERTGSWQEVAQALETDRDRNRWHTMAVARIEQESETITSFYLTPENGQEVRSHRSGQFLPIRMSVPGEDALVHRTYTVSNAPNGEYYRLSIKREPEGLISGYFHDYIEAGSTIETMAPRGKFVLEKASRRPVVLLSAGVGITPMMAMLDELLSELAEADRPSQIHFIHGTQDGAQQAFGAYLRALAAEIEALHVHIRFSKPGRNDMRGTDFDSTGRIDAALLKSILPLDDYEFYLCGPAPFMEALYDGLGEMGVREGRVHYESFGPAMVLKPSEKARQTQIVKSPAEGPIAVCFARSDIEAEWHPEKGTLLELAESEGLAPAFACRGGICGTCATKIKCGDVDYLSEPIAERADDEVLICCSTPRSDQGEESCGKDCGVILDL